MGTSLNGLTPATTFDALIKVGDNSALTASLKTISDGEGNDSPLKLSTSAVGIGSITNVESEINGKQATLVSGTSIKTINSTSLLGSGDIAVQETLISGTNVKTINSTSLLGSGDVAVQETLVSGTNIKTINSTSLLGSGDISISASAGGSNTQIQFNDSGAFGADSLFNWDNTNKRLGVGETTPTARVHIKGEGNTDATTSLLVQNSDGTTLLSLNDEGDLIASQGNGIEVFRVDSGDRMFRINQTNHSTIDFQYRGTSENNLIRADASQNAVGFGTTNPSARVDIKGSGSTSATTALRVKNSSNTDLLKVVNNGQVLVDVQSIEASAKVQIDSTTKGFLPPRMTTTQVEAIEPTAGLIVYDTSTNTLKCYDGSAWNNLF